jgi:membrane-associated phospholipid phosphatase
MAIGTAISRIYLVNHFIEDVVAGSLLGICIALFVYKLLNYFKVPSRKSIVSLKKIK